MASYTLRSESSWLRPEFEYREESIRRAVTDPDRVRGAYKRRQIEPVERRAFRLVWETGDAGQRELLLAAWNETRGVAAMNYTPLGDIDANAIEVWFAAPPSSRRAGLGTWALEALIEGDV